MQKLQHTFLNILISAGTVHTVLIFYFYADIVVHSGTVVHDVFSKKKRESCHLRVFKTALFKCF